MNHLVPAAAPKANWDIRSGVRPKRTKLGQVSQFLSGCCRRSLELLWD